jgi:hypothetical protein
MSNCWSALSMRWSILLVDVSKRKTPGFSVRMHALTRLSKHCTLCQGHTMEEFKRKTCSGCGEAKWVQWFWRSRSRNGHASRCIDCAKVARTAGAK